MNPTITGEELKKAMDRGDDLVILEALPPRYFRKAHIPGALSMPADDVDELAPELLPDKNTKIVVYCANENCDSSIVAVERLVKLGYKNVFDYVEGKADWIRRGYPVEKGQGVSTEASCCAG